MPVVAASITAADWHHRDQEHNIKGLPFGELAASGLWVHDGQDPVSHALMSQAVPSPVLWVINTFFGRVTAARQPACGAAPQQRAYAP